jgi:NAD(P)H-dependent FMN reductase
VPRLGVVVASVREGRIGLPIAEWVVAGARAHGAFDPVLVDLQAVGLPLLSEPHHPRLQKYEQETTKAWSAMVRALDAFVFVTAEYNHAVPPALLNALDHVYVEWNYKAAAFVSYGGVSAGMRSVQTIKPILTALKMAPIVEAVAIAFPAKLLDADGRFGGDESHQKALTVMLDELARWDGALRTLRKSTPT